MSTDIVEEPLSESYEFSDVNDTIIVTLFANGVFETKDIHIFIETDSLQVQTPGKIDLLHHSSEWILTFQQMKLGFFNYGIMCIPIKSI